jgi:DNA-binding IclR family transcriptional regulator
MPRPALSALRATAVLDLLTADADRAFSMAEIIRATKINIASCHALLAALTKRGYLARAEGGKSYILGPALIAVGQSAQEAQPLIARAQKAAEMLGRELGVAVLLSTAVDDEILALSTQASPQGGSTGMHRGQRFPLVAPAGVHFLAWAPEPEVDAWIAGAGESTPEQIAEWKGALSLVRDRGYQVTLRAGLSQEYAALFAEMAQGAQTQSFIERSNEFLHAHAWRLEQPSVIEPDERYEVGLIASPIFNRRGAVFLSLGIGGFETTLTGSQIKYYAGELMRTCLAVMNEDRATKSFVSV